MDEKRDQIQQNLNGNKLVSCYFFLNCWWKQNRTQNDPLPPPPLWPRPLHSIPSILFFFIFFLAKNGSAIVRFSFEREREREREKRKKAHKKKMVEEMAIADNRKKIEQNTVGNEIFIGFTGKKGQKKLVF